MTSSNEEFLRNTIKEFVKSSPENRMDKLNGGPYFDEPLVGFSDGDDALYNEFKSIIGDYHFTPRELLEKMAADGDAASNQGLEDISVVSYVLPITEETRISNRSQDKYPSIEWAHQREFGEMFNVKLREHLVNAIREKGYMAIAPHGSKYFEIKREVLNSNWSERHACYVAGLGTFSLSDGFITPAGIAHRCGNVVTNMKLTPTLREAENHYYNCLHYREDACRKCVERCPAGAITPEGHDKEKCRYHVYTTCLEDKREEYGVEKATGCGLCQTAVPCEFAVPAGAEQGTA
jgi:ferredoxin